MGRIIPYIKLTIPKMFQTTNQSYIIIYHHISMLIISDITLEKVLDFLRTSIFLGNLLLKVARNPGYSHKLY